MSNKSKKMNKVVKPVEVVEEEIKTEVVEAVVDESKETETTEVVEAKTDGSKDSEVSVEVETKKVFKPIAKLSEVNWKKVGADTLKVGVGLLAGFGLAKAMSGGEEPSEHTEVVDAEFTEIEQNDVNETQEEEI